MTKLGPPTIQQLARDCWLADLTYAMAVRQLRPLDSRQRRAVEVIYWCLACEETTISIIKGKAEWRS